MNTCSLIIQVMFLNLEDNQSVGAVPPVLLCHNLFQLLYEVADAASGNG